MWTFCGCNWLLQTRKWRHPRFTMSFYVFPGGSSPSPANKCEQMIWRSEYEGAAVSQSVGVLLLAHMKSPFISVRNLADWIFFNGAGLPKSFQKWEKNGGLDRSTSGSAWHCDGGMVSTSLVHKNTQKDSNRLLHPDGKDSAVSGICCRAGLLFPFSEM